MAANGVGDLFAIALAASKDKLYMDTLEKMQETFHELIITEADARRDKTATLIKSRAKLDNEIRRFQREYNRISDQLTPAARLQIENYLHAIEDQKRSLAREKSSLRVRR